MLLTLKYLKAHNKNFTENYENKKRQLTIDCPKGREIHSQKSQSIFISGSNLTQNLAGKTKSQSFLMFYLCCNIAFVHIQEREIRFNWREEEEGKNCPLPGGTWN